MVDATLYYVADPMCSWCWGFASTLEKLEAQLTPDVQLQLVLGGLAPDSDEPMDDATKAYVQRAWRTVAQATGAQFNFAFWEQCAPRRSTFPACRAVLAAGDRGREMFTAIQRAYYLEARNPSDTATLIELASELGIPAQPFADRLASDATQHVLQSHFHLRDRLQAHGFPALLLERNHKVTSLAHGFTPLQNLETALRHHQAIP